MILKLIHTRRSAPRDSFWAWTALLCGAGLLCLILLPFLHHAASLAINYERTVTVSGSSQTRTVAVQGKYLVINGDWNVIILHGRARGITINGDNNTFRGDGPRGYVVNGDFNHVVWAQKQ